jgi:hypothetical protein
MTLANEILKKNYMGRKNEFSVWNEQW